MTDRDDLTADRIERTLRWAMIEVGTAGLSDELGPAVLVPEVPAVVMPAGIAIAGPVVLMRRSRADTNRPVTSSFEALRAAVQPGRVVLVHCEPDVGAAFGSNIALHASCLRAQAIISDGPARDSARLAQAGAPCGFSGTDPRRPAGVAMMQVASASLFGTQWHTGDWFLRDADGVIRLTPDLAGRAARRLADTAGGELSALLGQE